MCLPEWKSFRKYGRVVPNDANPQMSLAASAYVIEKRQEKMIINPIAHIYNDFPEKFGLPRQSGLSENLLSRIVMEEEYRVPDAFRGITDYSHLWLIWEFESLTESKSFSPTVRPPKLGGNERRGVFATRSPNRPNRLGLTLVRLVKMENDPERGPVLTVAGADIRSGTPLYDIKPYIAYADQAPDAVSGFTEHISREPLTVSFEAPFPEDITEADRRTLEEVLALDPRPGYQADPDREYGMAYRKYQIRFRIQDNIVHVVSIES